jgi:hypothetical protein
VGLKSAGSGSGFTLRARAFAGLAWLGVWPAGLAQKQGLRGLGLLGYVVKAEPAPALPKRECERFKQIKIICIVSILTISFFS